MANIFSGTVNGAGYLNLETATGLTFTAGNVYTIQPMLSDCYIREGTVGMGFLVEKKEKVYLTKEDGVAVFVDPVSKDGVFLNIAEKVMVEEQDPATGVEEDPQV